MNRIKKTVMLAAVLMAPFVACAVPIIIGTEDWNVDDGGWIGSDTGANVDNGAAYQDTGALQATVNGPNSATYVRTSTGDSLAFTGDLDYNNSPLYVTFDFITTGTLPSALGLYFASSNGGHWWSYSLDLTGVPLNGSYTYTLNVTTAWNALNGASAGTFWADFGAIDWFGFYVQNTGAGGMIDYRFDNLELGYEIGAGAVPEPETVWMILAVVLSLGVTFRDRLAGMAGQLKARLVKA